MLKDTIPLLLALVLASVAFDLRGRAVPGALVAASLLGGFATAWLRGGLPAALDALLGAAVGLAVMMPLLALAWTSQEEARLMAAMGLLVGPAHAPVILGLGIFGALLLAGLARWGGDRLPETVRQEKFRRIPCGLSLSAGALAWAVLVAA